MGRAFFKYNIYILSRIYRGYNICSNVEVCVGEEGGVCVSVWGDV